MDASYLGVFQRACVSMDLLSIYQAIHEEVYSRNEARLLTSTAEAFKRGIVGANEAYKTLVAICRHIIDFAALTGELYGKEECVLIACGVPAIFRQLTTNLNLRDPATVVAPHEEHLHEIIYADLRAHSDQTDRSRRFHRFLGRMMTIMPLALVEQVYLHDISAAATTGNCNVMPIELSIVIMSCGPSYPESDSFMPLKSIVLLRTHMQLLSNVKSNPLPHEVEAHELCLNFLKSARAAEIAGYIVAVGHNLAPRPSDNYYAGFQGTVAACINKVVYFKTIFHIENYTLATPVSTITQADLDAIGQQDFIASPPQYIKRLFIDAANRGMTLPDIAISFL